MAAPIRKSMSGKKRKLADLTMEEFMTGDFVSSGSESDLTKQKYSPENRGKGKSKKQKKRAERLQKGVISKHKASLSKLQQQDPEFYEFLKEEDESLLQFDDLSGSDVTDTSDNEDTSNSDGPLQPGVVDDDSDDDDDEEDDSDDDEDEEDFPVSSDEEITVEKITKFMEKKNEQEIEKAKKALEDSKTAANKLGKDQKKKNSGKIGDASDRTEKDNSGAKKTQERRDKQKQEIKSTEDVEKEGAKGKQGKKHQIKQNVLDNKQEQTGKKTKDSGVYSEDHGEDGSDLDDEDVGEDFDMDASEDSDEEMFHKPPEELEVMSDSEEEEEGEEEADELGIEKKKASSKTVVSMKMVKELSLRFKKTPSPALLHEAVHAFRAAVQHTATDVSSTKYKVTGAKVYNAVVRMCLIEIPPAVQTLLNLPKTTNLQQPTLPSDKDKRWKKIKIDMKSYLSDVLKLMSGLSEANMVNILLKHVHKLIAFYACFPKLTKTLLKRVVGVWSSGEETSRVLAFLCINRLIRINQELHLENCIKQMYMAYVKNCKFTSPNTLPMINFMQRSYVEILGLDYTLAYQYAFVYIRQLAIHLRNAITTKKKESCQAVYNWQFVHCIGLWSRVLSATYPNEVLEPLIYPLVQTIVGTIKLIPTQRYYPLRFHCIRALTMISRNTQTFVPVLPFLIEVFEQTDFNKKHKTASIRPINFATILKCSKPQLLDKTFKDGVIDQLCELLLEEFHAQAHTIGFPELALPAIIQLKDFVKKCKVGTFTKQVKQILDQVDKNSKFVADRRRGANINIADDKAVDHWERECLESGPPLVKFYTTWRKLRDRELMHRIAAADTVIGKELPEIKRQVAKKDQKATDAEKKEFSALFDSDSEDNDTDLTESFLPPNEKKKVMKERQKKKEQIGSGDDDDDEAKEEYDDGALYEDFDSDELEQLAGSGSDGGSDVEYDDGKDPVDDAAVEDDDDNDESDDDDDGSDSLDSDEEDIPEKEDIVRDFTMSSDEDD